MITATNLIKFLKGQLTWAQAEGLTAEEATRYLRMGATFLQQGDHPSATRVFECLITLNPHDPDPHAFLGAVHQDQSREEAAVASYSAALALDPRHVLALSGRGELRLQRGDSTGLADLQRAAELDPMGRTAAGKRACGLIRAIKLRPRTAERPAAGAQR